MLSGFIHSALTSTEIDVLTELLAVSLSLTSGPWDLMWGACFVCSVCTATRSPWQGPAPPAAPGSQRPGAGSSARVCACAQARAGLQGRVLTFAEVTHTCSGEEPCARVCVCPRRCRRAHDVLQGNVHGLLAALEPPR